MSKALYSLFERQSSRTKWRRISASAFTLATARRVYQGQLLSAALTGGAEKRLRRVAADAQ